MKLKSTHVMEAGEWVEREKIFDSTNDSNLFFTFISENIFFVECGMFEGKQNNEFNQFYSCLIKAKPISIL